MRSQESGRILPKLRLLSAKKSEQGLNQH